MAKRVRSCETRTPSQILDDMGASVQQAEYFASEVSSKQHGERHVPSLVGLADAGYSVRKSLARLKHRVTGFGGWYDGKETEWEGDPLLVFFTRLREQRTHEGRSPRGRTRVHIEKLVIRTPDPATRPTGATSYTVDMFGRAAWHVPRPDGTERLVAAPPLEMGSIEASFAPERPPETHMGRSLAGVPLSEICDLYVTYLRRLLVEANTIVRGGGAPARPPG